MVESSRRSEKIALLLIGIKEKDRRDENNPWREQLSRALMKGSPIHLTTDPGVGPVRHAVRPHDRVQIVPLNDYDGRHLYLRRRRDERG
jgi:hypothetical protein